MKQPTRDAIATALDEAADSLEDALEMSRDEYVGRLRRTASLYRAPKITTT